MRHFIGVDMEELSRFKNLWSNKKHLLPHFFQVKELESIQQAARPVQKMAGIWCAKEAVIKAFGPVLTLEGKDITLSTHDSGYPIASITCDGIGQLDFELSVSISHTRQNAIAQALLSLRN